MKGVNLRSYIEELELLRTDTMHEKETIMIRWFNLFPADDYNQEIVSSVYDKIVDSYCAPHRHYHTMEHIEFMLNKIDEMFSIYHFEKEPEEKFALYCAAFFHDIVYNPQSKNELSDEELSVNFAVECLKRIGVKSVRTLERIAELIMVTKTHTVDDTMFTDIELQSIMIDADMGIMGTHREQYLQYAKDVSLEYSFVNEREFRLGRTKFLHDILCREAIFNTEYMRQVYEKDARLNIRTELAVLDKLSIDDLLNDVMHPEE